MHVDRCRHRRDRYDGAGRRGRSGIRLHGDQDCHRKRSPEAAPRLPQASQTVVTVMFVRAFAPGGAYCAASREPLTPPNAASAPSAQW